MKHKVWNQATNFLSHPHTARDLNHNTKVKGPDIYIPPLTGKPWPAAVNNSKWRTDRQ